MIDVNSRLTFSFLLAMMSARGGVLIRCLVGINEQNYILFICAIKKGKLMLSYIFSTPYQL